MALVSEKDQFCVGHFYTQTFYPSLAHAGIRYLRLHEHSPVVLGVAPDVAGSAYAMRLTGPAQISVSQQSHARAEQR